MFEEENHMMEFLLNEAYFELDPGKHYGDEYPFYMRMSVASPRRKINKVLSTLKTAIERRK